MTVVAHTDAVIQELTAKTASSGDLFLRTNGETAPLIQSEILADESEASLIAIVPKG